MDNCPPSQSEKYSDLVIRSVYNEEYTKGIVLARYGLPCIKPPFLPAQKNRLLFWYTLIARNATIEPSFIHGWY